MELNWRWQRQIYAWKEPDEHVELDLHGDGGGEVVGRWESGQGEVEEAFDRC